MQTKTPIRRAPVERSRRSIVVAATLALASSFSSARCSIYDLGGLESGSASSAGGAAGDGSSSTGATSTGGTGGVGGSGTENTGGRAGSLVMEEDGAAPSGAAGTATAAGGASSGSPASSTGGESGAVGGGAGEGGGGGTGVDASVPDASLDAPVADAGPQRNHPVCALGQCKLVFVSSSSVPANVGGVENFDRVCQKIADGRNLAGEWKAWVSDESSTASMRMTQATVPYRLLDGSTIARDWPGLASGGLLHAINVREDATTLSVGVEVWTGTLSTGARATFYCSNWTTTNGSGIVGMSEATSSQWTFAYQQYCWTPTVHIYCFEQ